MGKKNEDSVIELIRDLSEFDNEHLLLEPYELSITRLVKVSGELSYYFFSVDDVDTSKGAEVLVNFSTVRLYIMQLYIESVLINMHIGVPAILDKIPDSAKIDNFKDKFGLELVSLLLKINGALVEGLHEENAVLYGAATKLLRAFIFNVLDMYGVPRDDFYEQVEEFLFEQLAIKNATKTIKTSTLLKSVFNGSTSITIDAKIDKRRKNPFTGFNVVINNDSPVLFKNDSPVKAFLEATQYINEKTKYEDVKLRMSLRTKSLLNSYSILYAREQVLQQEMENGFYPILVPKGVESMDDFLDVLTK